MLRIFTCRNVQDANGRGNDNWTQNNTQRAELSDATEHADEYQQAIERRSAAYKYWTQNIIDGRAQSAANRNQDQRPSGMPGRK